MKKRPRITISLEPGYELEILAPVSAEFPHQELCVSKRGCARNSRIIRARNRKEPIAPTPDDP
ncbi:MAG: hypothetical protein PVSMB8_00610 [Vulcanimicrobiaceae bacterium]